MSAPAAQTHSYGIDPNTPMLMQPLARVLLWVNNAMALFGMLALLASAAVLTYSVISRYFLHASTDWQDEAAVFCLVGATFLCASHVQAQRGHVGIEALSGYLPLTLNCLRRAFVDLSAMLFCALFAYKSWTLFHEAWSEGQTTSSSWAPPLWIPYALMAAGMSLLTLQLFTQLSATANALLKNLQGGKE